MKAALLALLIAATTTCQAVQDFGSRRVVVKQECLDNPLAPSCMP